MKLLDLDGSAPRQSLDWLVELALRLDIVIDVVALDGRPACPVGSTQDAAAVRHLITSDEPALLGALSEFGKSRKPVATRIDSLVLVGVALSAGGAVLMARRFATEASAEEHREDLESIALWLAGAVDTSLAQPDAVHAESYRIVSFRRILREAVTRGSLRHVIGAFSEALVVWDDLRVRVYAAGASGGFFEYASSMAANQSSTTERLDESVLPGQGRIARLSRADVKRAGLAIDHGDAAIAQTTIGAGLGWALVFSGTINDVVQVRLRVYADLLREALNDVLTIVINRIVAELSRRPSSPNEAVGTLAQMALERLTTAVGARQAAMHVESTTDRQALTLGDADLLSSRGRGRGTRMLVGLSDADGAVTVVFDRDHSAFTAVEREIAQAGVAAMQPWVEAALPRVSDVERRGSVRPVETILDQLATDAVAAGQSASMIVMTVDATMLAPGLLPSWVARIRARLRAGDRAGMLNDREVAVLLYGASAAQAVLVTERLEHLLESRGNMSGFVPPTVGMITRVPETPFEGSLVAAARASARGRS